MRLPYLLAAPVVAIAGFSVAPVAVADCTTTGGTTLCSQGDSRGANTGGGPSGAGPYVPYPCDYDWTCDSYGWEWDVDLDWDPGFGVGGPGIDPGPGVGLPGTPGNRPGGGGGIGGGRGGGRR